MKISPPPPPYLAILPGPIIQGILFGGALNTGGNCTRQAFIAFVSTLALRVDLGIETNMLELLLWLIGPWRQFGPGSCQCLLFAFEGYAAVFWQSSES